ncbi:ABC transporter substrate-binding protein [Caproiciproducens sp. CPB-2]|uniref:ABC transporter substrate-binding protein n=1 Tax=unclassified Caproiciproducens TaxID=2643836 RepID=UPI0023DC92EB|nr:ABC transporter substrate-binding protein [Caproiciproducens sp. CPB-2]MDF1494756.1 ABC transporter substrate-binding protein [Caproiciproducens sp. CPB-2]
MKKTRLVAFVLAFCMALSLAGCNGSSAPTDSSGAASAQTSAGSGSASSGDTIKIGLIAMLTGANPLNGLRMQQAVQLAVDEYNEKGGLLGKKVELLTEDDQTLQDMAVTCANKLISEGVVGIVGPHRSTNAMAVEQVVASAGVPTLTGGTTPKISQLNNKFLFRCRASDAVFAEVAAQYAVEKLGSKKVGMFYNNDEFGTGGNEVAKAYCQKAGVEYVEEGHNTNDKDFTGQIMKMKNAKVDTVLIWTHDPELAIHARQIKDLGLNVNVVCSPGITMPQVIEMCKPEQIEGWYGVTDFVSTSTVDVTKTFVKNFEAKYNVPAELYSASYYGAAVSLLEAIKTAGSTDRTKVRDALAATKDLQVPVGTMTTDATNDMVHEVHVAKMVNAEPVYQETVKLQ